MRPHFLQPLLSGPSTTRFVIQNQRSGRRVATTLEPAFDSATRKRGLLGRDSLPLGHALIIAPCNVVHTFFMRFRIDILFATRDGKVVKISSNVPARRIVGAFRAFAVIELPAGAVAASETRAGDRLLVVNE